MPPPSLLSSTIVSARSSRRAASSPPMSWASATSPISKTTGPSSGGGAAPNADDTVPSIPFAPRLESTRGPASRAAVELLDVADRHRRGDEQRRGGRRATPRGCARRAARSSSSPSVVRSRRPTASSAARHESSHPARPVTSPAVRPSSTAWSGAGTRIPTTASGSCQVPSGSIAIWAPRALPATCAAAWTSADRRCGSRTPADVRPRTPGRAAEGRSARSPRRRCRAPDSGSASSGIAARAAKPASSPAPIGSRSAPATITIRPTGSRRPDGDALHRGLPTITYGPVAARPVRVRGQRRTRSSTSGSRSGKLRWTGPGGPSAAVQ